MSLDIKTYKAADIMLSIDDAITNGFSEYVKSYFDASKLTFDDGKKAAVFHVVPLSMAQMDICEQFPVGRIRNRYVVSYALRAVENLMIDGAPAKTVNRIDVQGDMIVDPGWFEAVPLSGDIIAELAAHIMRLSEPDPT